MQIEVDIILLDFFNWLRKLLYYRDQKVKTRPYEKLQTWRLSGLGLLHRVDRPKDMCPRDVGTYIFEPFRYEKKPARPVRDLHICCDHLEGLSIPIRHSTRGGAIATHRITVLAADHFISADGKYVAEPLFSVDDDLQGQSGRRDLHIQCILRQFALTVAAAYDRPEFDFLLEVDNAKRYCMQAGYTHTLDLPKVRGEVFAYGLDGEKLVRIDLG